MKRAWAVLSSTEALIVGGWLFMVIALASLAGCAAPKPSTAPRPSAAVAGTAAPSPVPGAAGGDYIGYGIGALVAYIVGSVGKGYVRSKLIEKEGDE